MRDELLQALHRAVMHSGTSAERIALWCGDFRLGATMGTGPPANPEVLSSLVIGSHLSQRSQAACDALGRELARICGAVGLVNGRGGEISYTSCLVTSET